MGVIQSENTLLMSSAVRSKTSKQGFTYFDQKFASRFWGSKHNL